MSNDQTSSKERQARIIFSEDGSMALKIDTFNMPPGDVAPAHLVMAKIVFEYLNTDAAHDALRKYFQGIVDDCKVEKENASK